MGRSDCNRAVAIAQREPFGYTFAVTEKTPIDEAANEADAGTPQVSLATRILHLQEEHRELDAQIGELYDYPYRDQLLLQRLKKKKLQIKDVIDRLKNDLIPDLNA